MAKQLLIETRMNSLSLQEGIQSKNPNCLGTLKGICADYKNPTRNNNFYSRKLWENVFNDPLVKESLQDRVLIGELDHPESRLETQAKNACIVMTDYKFNDTDNVVEGTFDILPTPQGKVLKSLLDYGCKLGVSSRGEGDVVEEDGINKIDEDTYYFVAFDAVVLPAVKSAKPALSESVHKRQSLKESLEEQIKSVTSLSELNMIKKVVEALEIPETDTLIESINTKANELEGITDSSNLIDDLANLSRELEEAKQENIRLKESVITYKDRLNKAVKACKTSSNDSEKEAKTFNESLQQKDAEIAKFKIKLREANSRYIELKEQTTVLEEKFNNELDNVKSSCDKRISGVKESYERKMTSLEESCNSKIISARDKTDTVKSSMDRIIYEKDREIDSLNSTINDLKEQIKVLESARYTQEEEQSALTDNLNAKLEDANNKINETNKKLQSIGKAYTELRESYVSLKSQTSGVSKDIIKESLKPNATPKEIDTLVESIIDKSDRYRSVSSLSDPLFSTTGRKTIQQKGNDGNDELRSFMGQAMKML